MHKINVWKAVFLTADKKKKKKIKRKPANFSLNFIEEIILEETGVEFKVFKMIAKKISPYVRPLPSQSLEMRLYVVLVWLRQGGSNLLLARRYHISLAKLCREKRRLIPILYSKYVSTFDIITNILFRSS